VGLSALQSSPDCRVEDAQEPRRAAHPARSPVASLSETPVLSQPIASGHDRRVLVLRHGQAGTHDHRDQAGRWILGGGHDRGTATQSTRSGDGSGRGSPAVE